MLLLSGERGQRRSRARPRRRAGRPRCAARRGCGRAAPADSMCWTRVPLRQTFKRLGAVADGEDGLAHVVRVLQQQLVEVVARRIGRGGAGMRRLAVLLRIDIGGRAGEQNAVAGFGKLRGFDVGEVERDHDGLAAGAGHRVHILGQSARGVLRIRVGNGDGDARLHGVDGNAGGARRTFANGRLYMVADACCACEVANANSIAGSDACGRRERWRSRSGIALRG